MSSSLPLERWREIDTILQIALEREPERRDAYVREACGGDEPLRREVASLLAAHDSAPGLFLERPAAEALGIVAPIAPEPVPAVPWDRAEAAERPALPAVFRRMVSARSATYVALAAVVLGLAVGMSIDPSAIAARWWTATPVVAEVPAGEPGLVVVDRGGRPRQRIPAERAWTPRFSPDGKRLAYGAFGSGRGTSDVWISELATGTTTRLTDDDADSNDPQWSADGASLAWSVSAPGGKDIVRRRLDGDAVRVVATRPGTQFPSDWSPDGNALLVTDDGAGGHDIIVQPIGGASVRPYAATNGDERGARISPDGNWAAYTSNETGQDVVYLDSYPRPGHRVIVSRDGGADPAWRGDGRELYYWHGDSLVAVTLGAAVGREAPEVVGTRVLFRAPYQVGISTQYDVSPDGERFVIVQGGIGR